jgi:hypothetical protein
MLLPCRRLNRVWERDGAGMVVSSELNVANNRPRVWADFASRCRPHADLEPAIPDAKPPVLLPTTNTPQILHKQHYEGIYTYLLHSTYEQRDLLYSCFRSMRDYYAMHISMFQLPYCPNQSPSLHCILMRSPINNDIKQRPQNLHRILSKSIMQIPKSTQPPGKTYS